MGTPRVCNRPLHFLYAWVCGFLDMMFKLKSLKWFEVTLGFKIIFNWFLTPLLTMIPCYSQIFFSFTQNRGLSSSHWDTLSSTTVLMRRSLILLFVYFYRVLHSKLTNCKSFKWHWMIFTLGYFPKLKHIFIKLRKVGCWIFSNKWYWWE